MEKPKILFVDDERFFARDYVNALSVAYEVVFCEEVDEAKKAILSKDSVFSAAIIDLQMPSPVELEPNEVVEFVDSGLWLLEKTFTTIVRRALPVIVLTNREFPTFKSRFEQLRFPENLVEVHVKFNTPCRKLVARLEHMLEYWKPENLDRAPKS